MERAQSIEDRSEEYRLLVPVLEATETEDVERLVETAAVLAREREGTLIVLYLATVVRSTPLDAISEDDEAAIEAREELAELLEIARETDTEADGIVYRTREESGSILNAVENENCDGIVLATQVEHSKRRRLLSGETVDKVLARAQCDVFTEKRGEEGPAGEETPIGRILLATSGGPHARLAADTTRALALAADAQVDVVHFLGENSRVESREDGEAILEAAQRILSGVENVETELAEAPDDVAEAIVARSGEYDKTVLGSPTSGLLRQFAFGTVSESVNQQSENGVVVAQQDTGGASMYDRWIVGDQTN
jgi:nucleotide-binding universal stress UspA family protein